MSLRAVFLDRDGVLNYSEIRDGKPYAPRSLEAFRIYPESKLHLSRLKKAGFLLIVVTNQPDVGNKIVKMDIIEQMHAQMIRLLPLDGIEVCYSSQTEGDYRRKPNPGMIIDASVKWNIDLSRSFTVGDRWVDIEAGMRAGCRTIWIDRGYSEQQPALPDFVAVELASAVDYILQSA
jgi:D-glycero-D-manno-heptose 1,7-bisphosphate phosphatase